MRARRAGIVVIFELVVVLSGEGWSESSDGGRAWEEVRTPLGGVTRYGNGKGCGPRRRRSQVQSSPSHLVLADLRL